MLKHIVAWDFDPQDRQANTEKMKALLEELPALIPEIQEYEVGVNVSDSEVSKDMILISSFDDESALQRYAVHPEHQRVVKELRKLAIKTVVVDYIL